MARRNPELWHMCVLLSALSRVCSDDLLSGFSKFPRCCLPHYSQMRSVCATNSESLCTCRVDKNELPALEFVAQNRQNRVDVSVMMAQQAGAHDVFEAATMFIRQREEAEKKRRQGIYSPMQVWPSCT